IEPTPRSSVFYDRATNENAWECVDFEFEHTGSLEERYAYSATYFNKVR
ncbi:hypothetical protein A2U01_0106132, partial [Trifolium medium]|nr:hypothetical protein [Trifolium medium]